MPISLATKGKYGGIPTKRMSAAYGGGTSAGIQYIEKPHKFPIVRIQEIDKKEPNININVLEVTEG